MATLLVSVVIVILILYFLSEDLAVAFSVGPIFGLIVGLILTIAVTTGNAVTVETVEIVPLHDLYDGIRTEGRVFLGSGYIDEVDYLFFEPYNEDGVSYSFQRVKKYSAGVGEVSVFEDEELNPHLEKTCKVRQLGKKSVWVFNTYYDNPVPYGCRYSFHVPVGGLDSEYSLR